MSTESPSFNPEIFSNNNYNYPPQQQYQVNSNGNTFEQYPNNNNPNQYQTIYPSQYSNKNYVQQQPNWSQTQNDSYQGGYIIPSQPINPLNHQPGYCKNNPRATALIITSLIVMAIAGIAAYYCTVNGLKFLDTARSSLAEYGAGFMIYSGVVFGVVVAGNALFLGKRLLQKEEHRDAEYTGKDQTTQVIVSILAPVVALPFIMCCACCALGSKK